MARPRRASIRLTPAQLRALARDTADHLRRQKGFEACAIEVATPKTKRYIRIFPTGTLPLDVSTRVGGLPLGRITLYHGDESSGKTTSSLLAIASIQRRGGIGVFVDLECKLNTRWAETLGVDMEALIYVVPSTIEEGLDFVDQCVTDLAAASPGMEVLIVWDSVHDGRSKRSLDAGYDGAAYGPESRAYTNGFAILKPKLARTQAALIAISQIRMNLNAGLYQPQTKVGVGRAMVHQATMIGKFEDSRPKGQVKGPVGQTVKVTWMKNHCANPWGVGQWLLVDGVGVDEADALLEGAKMTGLLAKKAGSLLLPDGRAIDVNGPEELRRLLAKEPSLGPAFDAYVRAQIGSTSGVVEEAEASGFELDAPPPPSPEDGG